MTQAADQWLATPGQSSGSGTAVLLEAARSGDARAFAALVAHFEQMVYKVAIGITRHPEDASDVVQQTWLVLLSKMHSIHTGEALPGWLFTTARREALRLVRERSRNLPLDPTAVERAEDLSDGPEIQIERRDLIERVNRALRQLPRQRRDFLVELVGRRAPYAEVAARFHRPNGSLGPLRSRYLNQLSRALEECGVTAA